MRLLREYIRTLLEYELQHGVRVYHRSPRIMKPGDIVKPKMINGRHWNVDSVQERVFERYRKEHYPELPSRLECVFGTLTPRSRFLSFGYLHILEPIGSIHVTNSMLIDTFQTKADRAMLKYKFSWKGKLTDEEAIELVYRETYAYIESYWRGWEPDKTNLNNTEVLMQSARVLELVDESMQLHVGDRIVFGSSARPIETQIELYHDDGDDEDHSIAPNGQKIFRGMIDEILKRTPGVVSVKHVKISASFVKRLDVIVGPGFECNIDHVVTSDPGHDTPKDRRFTKIWIAIDDTAPRMYLDVVPASRDLVNQFRKGLIKKLR